MLPQKHRITTEEFLTVMNNGKRLLSPHFSFVYTPNDSYFKASVVVSKKISKKAVDRNRQKRMAREALRKVFTPFDLPKASSILFVKKNILQLPFLDIEKEIAEFSKKIK